MFYTSPARFAIEAFFYAAPLSVVPLLDGSARMDLFDLYRDGQKAEVVNRFGGTSKLTHADDSSLHLRLTESSDWQLRLLSDSTLEVCRTYYTTDTTTVVLRYDKHWMPLP